MSLHEQILAEIVRREQVAGHASEGAWTPDWRVGPQKPCECCNSVLAGPRQFEVIATDDRLTEHIATHDPADALRRYAAARRVLERHHKVHDLDGFICGMCSYWPEAGDPGLLLVPWPCPDIEDLAASLGIEVPS